MSTTVGAVDQEAIRVANRYAGSIEKAQTLQERARACEAAAQQYRADARANNAAAEDHRASARTIRNPGLARQHALAARDAETEAAREILAARLYEQQAETYQAEAQGGAPAGSTGAVCGTGSLTGTGDAALSPAAGRTGQDTPMTSEQTAALPAPGAARQPMTDAEKAVLHAWSKVKVIDTSPEAMRLRAEAEEIRRRHRPAPETNRYTGTIKLDDLGLDPEETLAEAAQHLRWTADMYDDRVRESHRPRQADADAALFWHAAADAVEAAAAAEPPASRAPWPGMDDDSWQRWRHDELVLAQVQELEWYGDEGTEETADLRREAAAIERRRKLAHRAAIKAGVTPCVASRSKHTPCVHPDGDHHEGLCFAADGESWPRHTSWWAPETWDNQR
jgi:hypothetical protein